MVVIQLEFREVQDIERAKTVKPFTNTYLRNKVTGAIIEGVSSPRTRAPGSGTGLTP
jgi:hypothetical protein